MKKIILVLIITILVIIFLYFIGININFSGKVIENQPQFYSYTKAICNETNFCQDYEIICNGNELVETKSITGATIQHLKNWKDPRDIETIKRVCD